MQTHKTSNLYYVITALVILVIITFAYSNSLHAEFAFDDFANFVHQSEMHLTHLSFDNIKKAVQGGINHNRVFPNISFALNYYLNQHDVWGYHLVNLIIHTLTTLVVFALFVKTIILLRPEKHLALPVAEIAFVAALLWALHPLQTNAVTYIIQRMTSMAGLFYFSSLLAYLHARTTTGSTYKRYLLFTTCICFWIISLFSKETSIMLPLIILAYEIYFLRGHIGKMKIHRFVTLTGIFLAISIAIAFFYVGGNFLDVVTEGYTRREFTLIERLLTQSRVVFFYISLILLPLPSRLSLNHDFALSTSIIDPVQTIPSLVGIGLMIYLIFFFYKKNQLISFALLWFMVNLIIESTIIPLELVFEHRLYVPLAIPMLAAVTISSKFVSEKHKQVLRFGWIIIAILLFLGTWQRNEVWSSNVSLWKDVAAKSPELLRSYEGLVKAYNDEYSYQATSEICTAAEARNLKSVYLYNNCGFAALKLEKTNEGIRLLEYAIHLYESRTATTKFSDIESLYVNLSKAYLDAHLFQKSYDICKKAVQDGIKTTQVYNAWGATALQLHRIAEGIQLLKYAIRLDNANAAAHYNLASAYKSQGRKSEALRERFIGDQLMRKDRRGLTQ